MTDIKEIVKYLRRQLILQSELKPEHVLNALSVFGTELDKLLEKTVYVSYGSSDSVMLFELVNRDSYSSVSFSENSNIVYTRAYSLKCIIYGNDCQNIANATVARFRTNELRQTLIAEGIYLENITEPTSIQEYKNDMMWLRSDFSIDVCVEVDITPISQSIEFESAKIIILQETDE